MSDLFDQPQTDIDAAKQADATWFHIFRQMFDSGDVAKMGLTAYGIYSAIKCHVNFGTGEAFPSIDRLAEMTGLSSRQVMREMKVLEDMGYLTKKKQGRSNVYTLREKVQVINGDGRPVAEATWDYLPATVKAATAELKHYVQTGETGAVIHIENLVIQNLNVINAKDSPVDIVNVAAPVSSAGRKQFEAMVQKMRGEKGDTHDT